MMGVKVANVADIKMAFQPLMQMGPASPCTYMWRLVQRSRRHILLNVIGAKMSFRNTTDRFGGAACCTVRRSMLPDERRRIGDVQPFIEG